MSSEDALFSKINFSLRKRLPVVLQNQATECGLACLAMIASYYGFHSDLRSLRQKFVTSLKGITLHRLIEIGNQLGLQSRPIRAELDGLSQIQLPCILHWDMNHFVVLRSISGSKAVIHDPAVGVRILGLQEISNHFTGVLLELIPGANFKKKPAVAPSLSLKALVGRIVGLKRAIAQIFALALVLELFALLLPLFVQLITDQVLANGDRSLLTVLGTGFALLVLLQTAIAALRSWSVTCLSANINIAWVSNVFSHMMRLPEDFFQSRHQGDINSRFSSIAYIQQVLTNQFVAVLLDGLMALVTMLMMFQYSWKLTLITLAAFCVYGSIRFVSYRALREATSAEILASAKQQTLFLESLRGVQTIRLYNQTALQVARFSNKAVDATNCKISIQRLVLLFNSLNSFSSGMQYILMLWIGASLAISGAFSVGMLMAFAAYSNLFITRASGLVDYGIELWMLRLHMERLADIVLSDPESSVETGWLGTPPESSIELRNVSYRYAEGEPWIIRNCNIAIRAGESVAIVGPSGSGKTTLAKIILGLLEPQQGTVLVGGVDIKTLGKQNFRDMTSAVMQEDQLFAGTIADNICFFDGESAQARIEAAAHLASVHEDITKMPMSYHSLVGDMGSALSGGQRQRIMLARAFYRHPKILVLDEATSHMDVEREQKINEAIKRMKVTRVLIAHRPETIASADRIIDLLAHEQSGSLAVDVVHS